MSGRSVCSSFCRFRCDCDSVDAGTTILEFTTVCLKCAAEDQNIARVNGRYTLNTYVSWLISELGSAIDLDLQSKITRTFFSLDSLAQNQTISTSQRDFKSLPRSVTSILATDFPRLYHTPFLQRFPTKERMNSNLNSSFTSSSLSTQTNLYEFLSELVYKRIATINYLRRTHEGTTHWFNTVLLSREDLASMYQNSKMIGRWESGSIIERGMHGRTCEGCIYWYRCNRTLKFFTLGVSLGPILDVTNQVDYVKALHLLLHEFECHNNDHQRPKMVRTARFSSRTLRCLTSLLIYVEKHLSKNEKQRRPQLHWRRRIYTFNHPECREYTVYDYVGRISLTKACSISHLNSIISKRSSHCSNWWLRHITSCWLEQSHYAHKRSANKCSNAIQNLRYRRILYALDMYTIANEVCGGSENCFNDNKRAGYPCS